MARLGLFLACLLFAALPARAAVVAVPGGYDVSYSLNMAGTLNGGPVTSLFILETDGTNVSADFSFTASATGVTTLSHTIGFLPTKALLIGLDEAQPGGKTHIVMGLDTAFGNNILGQLFSVVFPGVNGEPRLGHDALIAAMRAADGGDQAALDVITHFFSAGSGAFATFDPAGGFSVGEFTGFNFVPEPTSLALLGAGLVGFAAARRRRAA